ncbi:MAG: hypothetical protein GY875_10855 [Gammaproteobacteria bacterium]|nr:hypothetical protein [Gammaproteobacteria bacterium]
MSELSIIRDAFVCGIDDWREIWGDPLLSGAIFMISYGVTALLIFRAARGSTGRERGYWRMCGFLFIFQFLNTNLDLHALVWTTGRCLAHAQGWYENRREVQLFFLIGLALLVVLILLTVMTAFLRNIAGNILLTLGVAIALGFTLVKGINYHGVEQFYGRQLGPFRVADYIEYSGIVIALLATLMRLRQTGPRLSG